MKVSPGCKNCYAEAMDKRVGGAHWGPGTERRTLSAAYWKQPILWNRRAWRAPTRPRVFCGSMCDVFEDHPTSARIRPNLWALIRSTPRLDWLLLTKRAENIGAFLPSDWGPGGYPNVWLGVSIESLEYSYRRSHLVSIPAAVRFISYEPALGPLDEMRSLEGIDWVIYGGESGAGRRPDDPQWALDMWTRCSGEGVAFFMKQSSAASPGMLSPLLHPQVVFTREFPDPLSRIR